MTDGTRKVSRRVMKQFNKRFVFDEIFRNRSISRPQLARLTGLTSMTTGRIADEFIAIGLVREASEPEETAHGRPPKLLEVASDSLLCPSVSLVRTGIQLGVTDPYGNVRFREHIPLPLRDMNAEEAIHIAAEAARKAMDACGLPLSPVLAFCLPGLIDNERGTIVFTSQFRWQDVPLGALLRQHFPSHAIVIDNDLKARAMAEQHFGALQPFENAIVLAIGSGIGAAIIIDGQIYRGVDNSAGEIGHITMNPGARMCECGKIGCLQTYLTDWSILQEARLVLPDATLDDVFAAFAQGQPWAKSLIGHAAEYACIAINLLSNTYAPEAMLLCGSLVDRYPIFRQLIVDNYAALLTNRMPLPLSFSTFGDDGGIIGGGALAFDRLLDLLIV